jgi:hypothetical protein
MSEKLFTVETTSPSDPAWEAALAARARAKGHAPVNPQEVVTLPRGPFQSAP